MKKTIAILAAVLLAVPSAGYLVWQLSRPSSANAALASETPDAPADLPQDGPSRDFNGRGGPGGAGGMRGQRGQFGQMGNRDDFRQRMNADLQQQLGASDTEFVELQQKIDEIRDLQREANDRGPGGPGGPGRAGPDGFGGPGGPGGGPMEGQGASAVQQASADLRTTLQDKSAGEDAIKAKLTALREARTTANEKLAKARAELADKVDARQAAMLTNMGILE